MVVSVGNNYQWRLSDINESYHDRVDYNGLFFWYDEIEKPKKK